MELEVKIPRPGELEEYYLNNHNKIQIAQADDDFVNDLNTIRYQKKSFRGWETISFEKIRNVGDAKQFINEVKITYIN